MLGAPPKNKNNILKELNSQVIQVEMTVQALECFVEEDRELLMILLKRNMKYLKDLVKRLGDN